jgi:hypothetical protein
MATTATTGTEKHDKPRDTVAGYAGPAARTVQPEGKIVNSEKLPEGTVFGEGGSVTRPPEVSTNPTFLKTGNKLERYAGKVLVEGDTHAGYHYKFFVEVLQPVTEDGIFNIFRGHQPDAIREGFKCKAVTEEEADKLAKEWAEKMNEEPSGDEKGKHHG